MCNSSIIDEVVQTNSRRLKKVETGTVETETETETETESSESSDNGCSPPTLVE